MQYPLGHGSSELLQDPVIGDIAQAHGKSAAQVALRWNVQRGVVVIPKSVHKERMAQNFDVFDFTLSEEDMTAIRGLDEGESLFFSHYDPETVEFLTGLVK